MFLGVCVGCVFFWCCFAYVFALLFGFFAPETVFKNSLDVRSGVCFWVFFSPLWFFRRCRRLFVSFFFFFFQRGRSGSHRAHPHTHLVFFCPFLFVSPPRPGLSPVLAVRPSFLAFCRGAILGPGRFGVFWILSVRGGAEITRPPSEALFSDARRQGCFFASRACVAFPLFRFVLRLHTFSRSPSRLSSRSGQPE